MSRARTERREAQKAAMKEERRYRRSLRPLDFEQAPPRWVVPAAFLAVALIVLIAVGGPLNLFSSRLPFGADQVGQNWWLLEFRHRLLAGDPLGWSNATNNGYLFGYFYFPLAPTIVTVFAFVFSSAAAIKLMVFASVMTIPAGLWRLGRGLGFSPLSQVMAIFASLAVLFNGQLNIVGGNIFSSYVGEFSYALGLGLGLWCLGVVSEITKGSARWWPAGVFAALALLGHAQATLAIALAAAALLGFQLRTRAATLRLLYAALLAAGLSAWWWMASLSVSGEDLGDGHYPNHNLLDWLFTNRSMGLSVMGIVGLSIGLFRRRPGARVLAVASALCALVVVLPLQAFDTGRMIPVTFALFSLALVYVAELCVAGLKAKPEKHQRIIAALLAATAVGAFLVPTLTSSDDRSRQISVDARANAGWAPTPGNAAITAFLDKLNTLPGGRIVVETPSNFNTALDIGSWYYEIPLATNGRFSTPVSLFPEASRSSVAIEYAYGNLSTVPHTSTWWAPQSGSANILYGVHELSVLGIQYYAVTSDAVEKIASKLPQLTLVAVSAPKGVRVPTTITDSSEATRGVYWIYRVKDAPLVTGITSFKSVAPSSKHQWVLNGIDYLKATDTKNNPPVPVVGLPTLATPRSAARVTDVKVSDQSISFNVDRAGIPVIIRVSYAPQWQVQGGQGPFRAAPDYMVVVPSTNHVVLTFTPPFAQRVGAVISVASLAGLVLGLGLGYQRRRRGAKGSDAALGEKTVDSPNAA